MGYQLPGGKVVSVNDSFVCPVPVTVGEETVMQNQTHPRGWLRTASEQDLADRGITIVNDPTPVIVDHRFYFQSGVGDPVPKSLDQIRPMFIGQIKDQARGIILAAFPEWKQANMTARGVELTMKVASGGAMTSEEIAEAASLQAAWDWIKSVRSHSNELEDEVMELEFDDLVTWQPHDWPEPAA